MARILLFTLCLSGFSFAFVAKAARITPTTVLGVRGFFERYAWQDPSNRRNLVDAVQIRVRLSPVARKEFERLHENWGRRFPTSVVELKVFGVPVQAIRTQLPSEARIVVFTAAGRRLASGFQKQNGSIRWDR